MYVYLLKVGQFMKTKDEFSFYDEEVFTSLQKALDSIDNRILCNKGYNVVREEPLIGDKVDQLITYDCLGYGGDDLDTPTSEMRIRYHLKKLKLS